MTGRSPNSRRDTALDSARKLSRSMGHAGLGIQFAATIGVFCALGWWLDRWLGTSPWLLIVLTFVGFAGAFVALIRQVPPPTGSRERESD